MEQCVSRRDVLKAAVAAGGMIVGRSVFGDEMPAENVNDLLRAIPEDLPHVVGRKELLTDGAVHAIVDIPDLHWNNDLTRSQARAIETCQRCNRTLFRKLIDEGVLETMHLEAEPAEGEPPFDPRHAPILASAKQQGFYGVHRIAEIGAARLLAEEKKLILRGGELTATWDASGPMYFRPHGPKWRKVILEDREDALLEIAVRERRRIMWTAFGCWHDWEDNVRAWNETNPTKKFSYVRLLTQSAADYLKQNPNPFVAKPARAPR